MTVGEKIKLLRVNRKLSIEEVSKDSQINAKKLKRIEKKVIFHLERKFKNFVMFLKSRKKK